MINTKIKSDIKILKNQKEIGHIKKVNFKTTNFKRTPSNKCGEIILSADEIKHLLGGRISGKNILKKQKIKYPRYWYGFINKAADMCGATRSNKIGKLHVLYGQRKYRSLNEWIKYHKKRYPNAIKNTVNAIYAVLDEIGLDKKNKQKYKKYIRKFAENLIFNQTYAGLKIQEAILIKISQLTKENYRWTGAKEDSSGVDGFIGRIPVSIKPKSCQGKKKAGTKRIYYVIDEKKYTLSFTFSL